MNWTVPTIWEGRYAFILAGGPSLRGFDADCLRGQHVISINDSWRVAPWAEIHYACDAEWFANQRTLNRRSLDDSTDFARESQTGIWVSCAEELRNDPRVLTLRVTGQLGFDPIPTNIRTGNNSGYQAIHLAAQLGAKTIVLLGYDMRESAGRTHWHNEPRGAGFGLRCERSFLPCFRFLAKPLADRGVQVLNATPDSALDVWPRVKLEDVLRRAAPWRREPRLEVELGGTAAV